MLGSDAKLLIVSNFMVLFPSFFFSGMCSRNCDVIDID